MQMTAHRVERLLRVNAPIDCEQVVRHEQQPDGWIGGQPVYKGLSAKSLDCLEHVRECSSVNCVNSIEESLYLRTNVGI